MNTKKTPREYLYNRALSDKLDVQRAFAVVISAMSDDDCEYFLEALLDGLLNESVTVMSLSDDL